MKSITSAHINSLSQIMPQIPNKLTSLVNRDPFTPFGVTDGFLYAGFVSLIYLFTSLDLFEFHCLCIVRDVLTIKHNV